MRSTGGGVSSRDPTTVKKNKHHPNKYQVHKSLANGQRKISSSAKRGVARRRNKFQSLHKHNLVKQQTETKALLEQYKQNVHQQFKSTIQQFAPAVSMLPQKKPIRDSDDNNTTLINEDGTPLLRKRMNQNGEHDNNNNNDNNNYQLYSAPLDLPGQVIQLELPPSISKSTLLRQIQYTQDKYDDVFHHHINHYPNSGTSPPFLRGIKIWYQWMDVLRHKIGSREYERLNPKSKSKKKGNNNNNNEEDLLLDSSFDTKVDFVLPTIEDKVSFLEVLRFNQPVKLRKSGVSIEVIYDEQNVGLDGDVAGQLLLEENNNLLLDKTTSDPTSSPTKQSKLSHEEDIDVSKLPRFTSTPMMNLTTYTQLNPKLKVRPPTTKFKNNNNTNNNNSNSTHHQDQDTIQSEGSNNSIEITPLEQHHLQHGFGNTMKDLYQLQILSNELKEINTAIKSTKRQLQTILTSQDVQKNENVFTQVQDSIEYRMSKLTKSLKQLQQKRKKLVKQLTSGDLEQRYKQDHDNDNTTNNNKSTGNNNLSTTHTKVLLDYKTILNSFDSDPNDPITQALTQYDAISKFKNNINNKNGDTTGNIGNNKLIDFETFATPFDPIGKLLQRQKRLQQLTVAQRTYKYEDAYEEGQYDIVGADEEYKIAHRAALKRLYENDMVEQPNNLSEADYSLLEVHYRLAQVGEERQGTGLLTAKQLYNNNLSGTSTITGNYLHYTQNNTSPTSSLSNLHRFIPPQNAIQIAGLEKQRRLRKILSSPSPQEVNNNNNNNQEQENIEGLINLNSRHHHQKGLLSGIEFPSAQNGKSNEFKTQSEMLSTILSYHISYHDNQLALLASPQQRRQAPSLHTLSRRYKWGKGRFTARKFMGFLKKIKSLGPLRHVFKSLTQKSWYKSWYRGNNFMLWGMHKSLLKSIPQVYLNFWIKWAYVWQLPPIPFAIPPPPFFLVPSEYKRWFLTTWRWALKLYYYTAKLILKPLYFWVPDNLKQKGVSKDITYSLPDNMLDAEKKEIIERDGAIPTRKSKWKDRLFYEHSSDYIVPMTKLPTHRYPLLVLGAFTSWWQEVHTQWQDALQHLGMPKNQNIIDIKVDLNKHTFTELVERFDIIQLLIDRYTINTREITMAESLLASISHAEEEHLVRNFILLCICAPKVYKFLGPLGFFYLWTASAFGANWLNRWVQNRQGRTWDVSLLEHVIMSQSDLFSPAEIAHVNDVIMRPTMGASGALMGVLIAMAALFPKDKFKLLGIPLPVPVVVSSIVLLECLSMENHTMDNIDHSGHIGGAIAGLGAMLVIWYIPLLGKYTPIIKYGTNLPIVDWMSSRQTIDPDKIDYRNWKPEEGYHENLVELWRTATWKGYLHDPTKFFTGNNLNTHHKPRVRYMWSSHYANRAAWVETRRKYELRNQLGDIIGDKLPNFVTTTKIRGPIVRMTPELRAAAPVQREMTYHKNIQRRAVQRIIFQQRTISANILQNVSWNAFSNSRVIYDTPEPYLVKDPREVGDINLDQYYDGYGNPMYQEEFVGEVEQEKMLAKQKLLNLGLITQYNEEKYDKLDKALTPEEFILWERRRVEEEQDEQAQEARDRFIQAITIVQKRLNSYTQDPEKIGGAIGKIWSSLQRLRELALEGMAYSQHYGRRALQWSIQQQELMGDYFYLRYQTLPVKVRRIIPFGNYFVDRRQRRTIERLEHQLQRYNPFVNDHDVDLLRQQYKTASIDPSQNETIPQQFMNQYAIPTGNRWGYFDHEIMYDQMKHAHRTGSLNGITSRLMNASKKSMFKYNPVMRLLKTTQYTKGLMSSPVSSFHKIRIQKQLVQQQELWKKHNKEAAAKKHQDALQKQQERRAAGGIKDDKDTIISEDLGDNTGLSIPSNKKKSKDANNDEPELQHVFPDWYQEYDFLNPPIIFNEDGEYIIPERTKIESFPYQVYVLDYVQPPDEIDLGEAGNVRLRQLFRAELRDREIFQKSMTEYESGYLPEDMLSKVVERIKERDLERKSEILKIRDELQESILEQDRYRNLRIQATYLQQLQNLEVATQDHRVRLQDEKRLILDKIQDVWLNQPENKVESRLFQYFRPNATEEEVQRGRRLLQHFLLKDPTRGVLPLFNQYTVKVRPIPGKRIIDPYHLLIDLQTYGKHAFINQPIPTAKLHDTTIDVHFPISEMNKKLWFPKTREEAEANRQEILSLCPDYFEQRQRVLSHIKRRKELQTELNERKTLLGKIRTLGKTFDNIKQKQFDEIKKQDENANDLEKHLEPGNFAALNPLYEEGIVSEKEKEFDKFLKDDYEEIQALPELAWETPEYKAKRLEMNQQIQIQKRKRDQIKRYLWEKQQHDADKKLHPDKWITPSRLKNSTPDDVKKYFQVKYQRLRRRLLVPPPWLLKFVEKLPWLSQEIDVIRQQEIQKEIDKQKRIETIKQSLEKDPTSGGQTDVLGIPYENKLEDRRPQGLPEPPIKQPYEEADDHVIYPKKFVGVTLNYNDTTLSTFPHNYTIGPDGNVLDIYKHPAQKHAETHPILDKVGGVMKRAAENLFREPGEQLEGRDPFVLTKPNTRIRRPAQYWNAMSTFNPITNPFLTKVYVDDRGQLLHEPIKEHPIIDDYKAIQHTLKESGLEFGKDFTKLNPQLNLKDYSSTKSPHGPDNWASPFVKEAASIIKSHKINHNAYKSSKSPMLKNLPSSLDAITSKAILTTRLIQRRNAQYNTDDYWAANIQGTNGYFHPTEHQKTLNDELQKRGPIPTTIDWTGKTPPIGESPFMGNNFQYDPGAVHQTRRRRYHTKVRRNVNNDKTNYGNYFHIVDIQFVNDNDNIHNDEIISDIHQDINNSTNTTKIINNPYQQHQTSIIPTTQNKSNSILQLPQIKMKRTPKERKQYIKDTINKLIHFISQPKFIILSFHPAFAPFTLEAVLGVNRKRREERIQAQKLPKEQFGQI